MLYRVWTPGEEEQEDAEWQIASSEEGAVRMYLDNLIGLDEAAAVGSLGVVAVETEDKNVQFYEPHVEITVEVTLEYAR